MRAPIKRPNLLWRAFVLGGVGTMSVLAVNDSAWEWWEENVSDAVPRATIRNLVAGTAVVHLGEALLARRWARRAGVEHAGAYARTTLVYGFPELRHLRRAIAAGR